MLKKIFKTIFIMSLCVGISLPTNAAVSVSDGSAFVTKAEFAADLNNLSNRMAQLENSLDAKIDSLVSSYLTRNGIWNGAKQNMNYMNQVLEGANGVDKVDPNCWLTWFNKEKCVNGKNNVTIVTNQFVQSRYKLIEGLNKTGMLFGNYVLQLALYGADGSRPNYKMLVAGFSLNSTSYEKSIQTYLSWYEGDGVGNLTLIQRQLIYNMVFPASGENTTLSNIAGFPISGCIQGFVSKGNDVYIVPEYVLNNGKASILMNFNKEARETYGWKYSFTSTGFYVY